MSIEILKNHKVKDIRGVHLFHNPYSNNSLRARLILEEKQIPWESHIVELTKFEQFSPEFLEINPQASVPAMVHDGISVYGSENILKYTETVFLSHSLTPQNKETTMWDWVEAATRTHINSIVYYLYAVGKGRPAPEEKLYLYRQHNIEKYQFLVEKGNQMSEQQKEEAFRIVHLQMLRLESALQNKFYILGNSFSVPDVAWVANTIILDELNFDFTPYPKVKSWMDQIKNRASYNEKSLMPSFNLKR